MRVTQLSLLFVALTACTEAGLDASGTTYAYTGEDAGVFRGSYEEVYEQGLTRYVATTHEASTSVSGEGPAAITQHHFSSENRGPLCMYGSEFFVETREGKSDDLLIFLQGGGVCLNSICAATPDPILTLDLFNIANLIGVGGLLDPANTDNPLRDFDVVNVPYCDGSLFMGDVDRFLSDGDPTNGEEDQAYQRGLQNLTAALVTAHETFPNPRRVVLVGSSGGAYGVLAGTAMVRRFYPELPLLVISDSGAPVVNGVDKNFVVRSITELNAASLVPQSCPECLENGHTTKFIEWALRVDPNLTMGYMTHARDHVIGEFFMKTTADQFQDAVSSESEALITDFPGRAFRFVVPSARHTLAMGADAIDEDLQGLGLGVAGSLGTGFVGPDVAPEELSTWRLGGMNEAGIGADGKSWTAYRWVAALVNSPAQTVNVFQLE